MFFLFSLFAEHFFALLKDFFVKQVSSFKEEVCEEFSRVFRNFLAQLNKTFSKMRHNVVHEVLSNGLRAFVKKIAFVLSDFFKSLRFFLILGLFSNSFFSFALGPFTRFLFVALSSFDFGCDQISNLILLFRHFFLSFLNNLFALAFDWLDRFELFLTALCLHLESSCLNLF